MMNKDIKQQWVAALRSGEYQQGDNYLRRGDTYSALGVLMDLLDPTKWFLRVGSEQNTYDYMGYVALAGEELRHPIGLDNEATYDICQMYDRPFSEIADFIEATL